MALAVTISVFETPVTRIDNLPYGAGVNVQQAMEIAYNADPAGRKVVQFTLEYFGASLGYELTALDAIGAQSGGDGETFLFWELSINGQISETGIDQTYPADGDTIGWDYTIYSAERHAGTRYEALRTALAHR
jgi:hypothetical protein